MLGAMLVLVSATVRITDVVEEGERAIKRYCARHPRATLFEIREEGMRQAIRSIMVHMVKKAAAKKKAARGKKK